MPPIPDTLPERRCSCCNALLFTAKIEIGIVRIKCKCGTYNTIVAGREDREQFGRNRPVDGRFVDYKRA